jgi:hypothetical protein
MPLHYLGIGGFQGSEDAKSLIKSILHPLYPVFPRTIASSYLILQRTLCLIPRTIGAAAGLLCVKSGVVWIAADVGTGVGSARNQRKCNQQRR